jgi:hypothetical protein
MSNSTLNLSCKIDAQKLFTAFMQVPLLAARELRTELEESLRVVQVDAKLHHEFKSHTHGLENAVQYEVKGDGLSGRVYLEQSRAPYAAAVHNGSKRHRIAAKDKQALFFVKGGTGFLVPATGTLTKKNYWENAGLFIIGKGYVNHPGYKGDPFLFNSVKRQWPYIMARIRGATNRVFQMAGLK